MKKCLTLILILAVMLTSAAMANAPDPSFFDTENADSQETVQETIPAPQEEKTAAPKNYTVPEGTRAYQYMLQLNGETGFMIGDFYFSDSVRAADAAEKSLTITPESDENKLLDVKYVLRVQGYKNADIGEVSCSIVDGNGEQYESRMWIESSINEINNASVRHDSVDAVSHANAYLIPVVPFFVENRQSANAYYLFDCVAEIPENVIGSDLPLYIVIHNMGESDYYVRIQ